MNNSIRNALLALAAVGALSLSACKTSGDSMDEPASEATPAPASDTTTPAPADSTATPAPDATAPAAEAPPAQDGTTTTP